MAGIKDIAKIAGVSISTVSYALNGSNKVTEETRKRIKAIADELNYVPNMAARTLKRQQTNIIGVYLVDYGGSFYGELLEGIKRGLAMYNYEMIVCSGNKSHLFIPEKMIDGAIILDFTFSSEEIIRFADRGHPIVVLDRKISHSNIRKVLLDNKGGATLAVEKMASLGTENVYVITGPKDGYDSTQRLEASQRELERFAIPYHLIDGDFTEPSGYRAAAEIMKQANQLPIDIFAFNDEMAIGVYKYFKDTEYEIGKDVRIIGFDNIEIGEFLRPKLTTISYSKHRWGMLAAEKIIRLINDESVEDEHIYTSLVERASFL